jgi:hypothetical protein
VSLAFVLSIINIKFRPHPPSLLEFPLVDLFFSWFITVWTAEVAVNLLGRTHGWCERYRYDNGNGKYPYPDPVLLPPEQKCLDMALAARILLGGVIVTGSIVA